MIDHGTEGTNTARSGAFHRIVDYRPRRSSGRIANQNGTAIILSNQAGRGRAVDPE